MKRTLQVALIVAGSVPLALGLMNFVQGAEAPWLPQGDVSPNTDNQARFYAIWFTLPFLMSVWMARNLASALPVAQILFGTMCLAGFARLYSVTQVGWPDPPMIGAMIAEIVLIGFVPWIAYVNRQNNFLAA